MASEVRRRKRRASATASMSNRPSAILSPLPSPTCLPVASPPPSIAELKISLSSRLDSLRKDADQRYATLVKEVDAAAARLTKRLKLEIQSCAQNTDELDRDWKAFSADFKEDMDEVKGDCEKLVSRAQNAASHYTKKAIPELMKSVGNDIEKLRSRFVLPQIGDCDRMISLIGTR